jgi:hypothetical protein
MAIVGAEPGKETELERFCRAAAPLLSKYDSDGFGYMATDGTTLFGERWLENSRAFTQRKALSEPYRYMQRHLSPFINVVETYNSFGEVPENPFTSTTIVLHARAKTHGALTLANTHPFTAKDTALVHNGMVNEHVLTLKTSQCDSEGILNEYLEHDVAKLPQAIDDVASMLDGYYACVVLAKRHGKVFVDIFKEDAAKLVAAYVEELDAFVFCTSSQILWDAAKTAKLTIKGLCAVNPDLLIRLDGRTGTKQLTVGFDSSYVKSLPTKGSVYRDGWGKVNAATLKEVHESEAKSYDGWEYSD